LLAFLRAYFDAFWWWGCFLDFAFCDQLLKEWEQREPSERGRQVLAAVRKFQHAYPKESQDRHSTGWAEVEAAVMQVQVLAGLDGDPLQWTDPERRHVRAFTDIFLAEASRFGRADYLQAASRYQEALDLFEKNDDAWNRAWVLYHFADMNIQRGNGEVAMQQLERSLALGTSQQDPEVIALAYRLRGDFFLAVGDLKEASENFQRALFHAYRFQVEPLSPDPYTVQFYAQTVSHVLAQLQALHARQKAQAVALSVELRGIWTAWWKLSGTADAVPDMAGLWEEGNMENLRAALFPPVLPGQDLAARGAGYEAQVKTVLQGMAMYRS
jgi:tetratricopeptide (TPR) repeat protein